VMRALIFAVVLMCSPVVVAAPVSFDFHGVTVVAFSQATFKSLLNRDFVIAPEVLSMDKRITVSVRAVEQKNVAAFVENILAGQGIAVTEKDGVYYLAASKMATMVPTVVDTSVVGVKDVVRGAAAVPAGVLDVPADSVVFAPQNRSAEFIAAALVAVFSPKSCVVAGSAVVFTGSPAELKKLNALAGAIDQSPNTVDVSVSWVEVARSTGSARGVSLAVSVLGAKLGVSVGSLNSGGSVSIGGAKFQAVIDALETDGRFKQVSNSRVVGDDREVMTLTVGDETPTIGSSGKDNQGNSLQNVVYRPSGVIVNVTPRTLGNGKISLAIDGQISSFKSTVTGVSGSPTLIKRQVKTGVTVASGEVLLIGGLSDEHSNETGSRLSFLPASWRVKNSGSVSTDLVLIVSAKAASL